jgi:hypothetical protein
MVERVSVSTGAATTRKPRCSRKPGQTYRFGAGTYNPSTGQYYQYATGNVDNQTGRSTSSDGISWMRTNSPGYMYQGINDIKYDSTKGDFIATVDPPISISSRYIPPWRYPAIVLSSNSSKFSGVSNENYFYRNYLHFHDNIRIGNARTIHRAACGCNKLELSKIVRALFERPDAVYSAYGGRWPQPKSAKGYLVQKLLVDKEVTDK